MKKADANTLKDILCIILLIFAMIYSKIAPAMACGPIPAGENAEVSVEESVEWPQTSVTDSVTDINCY